MPKTTVPQPISVIGAEIDLLIEEVRDLFLRLSDGDSLPEESHRDLTTALLAHRNQLDGMVSTLTLETKRHQL
jgi:hypothetical protein